MMSLWLWLQGLSSALAPQFTLKINVMLWLQGLRWRCTIEFEAWAATLRLEICQFKVLALRLKLEMINLMLGLQGPGLNCSMLRLRPKAWAKNTQFQARGLSLKWPTQDARRLKLWSSIWRSGLKAWAWNGQPKAVTSRLEGRNN